MGETPFHFDRDIQQYCFAKILDSDVAAAILARAQDVVKFVSTELGIKDHPRVRWIRPASPEQARATLKRHVLDRSVAERNPHFFRYCSDVEKACTPCDAGLNEIWIRAELVGSPELECVAAHEVRHAWQKSSYPEVFADDCRAEGDATPYGYELAARYLDGGNRLTDEARKWIEGERSEAERNFHEKCPGVLFEVIATS